MPKLPAVSGKKIVKALRKFGYKLDHQTGGHLILRQKEYPHRRLTVPNHSPIAKGTLNAIIKQSGLTREELMRALK
ncbi:MAG: type II toxin-antitoxin system HicA family toxin [Candidatus Diapherotrites archaeon]